MLVVRRVLIEQVPLRRQLPVCFRCISLIVGCVVPDQGFEGTALHVPRVDLVVYSLGQFHHPVDEGIVIIHHGSLLQGGVRLHRQVVRRRLGPMRLLCQRLGERVAGRDPLGPLLVQLVAEAGDLLLQALDLGLALLLLRLELGLEVAQLRVQPLEDRVGPVEGVGHGRGILPRRGGARAGRHGRQLPRHGFLAGQQDAGGWSA
mmetsp:Transcript_62352/g.177082  ORF Transcript_62352/g.177082 Transcript_62352/m.177082 type:complete len:204 (+) Transcript_62352:435-1046(+)